MKATARKAWKLPGESRLLFYGICPPLQPSNLTQCVDTRSLPGSVGSGPA